MLLTFLPLAQQHSSMVASILSLRQSSFHVIVPDSPCSIERAPTMLQISRLCVFIFFKSVPVELGMIFLEDTKEREEQKKFILVIR